VLIEQSIETYVRADESNTPIAILSDYKDEEVDWFKNKGTASISGTAKFKSKQGVLKFGKEFWVELMPASTYTTERLRKIYGNNDEGFIFARDGVPRFIPDPAGYHETLKMTCDENGAFTYSDLPTGSYYLIAFMLWNDEANILSGGGIMKQITLEEGEEETIVMDNF